MRFANEQISEIKGCYMNFIRCLTKLSTVTLCVVISITSPTSEAKQQFRKDTSVDSITNSFRAGSHAKVYLPNLPYIASSHSINAGLVRPANNQQGWEYDMAVSHNILSPRLYEFELRKGVKFQDGTPFDADSVLMNIDYFMKKPYTFTKLHKILEKVEKVSQHKIRFHLSEDYGLLMYDAIWLHFYTEPYLKKFGWNGKPFCPNLAEAGPYGLGPYILKEGYIEGDRRTDTATLVANPHYWDENSPKVEKITLFMGMSQEEAKQKTLQSEGEIDITPVLFSDEVETIFAPYSKLSRLQSTNTYISRFNLFNGHPIFREREIREVINEIIDQESLVSLSMNGEGVSTYVSVAEQLFGMKEALDKIEGINRPMRSKKELQNLISQYKKKHGFKEEQKIPIRLLAQQSMQYILKDIKFFIEKYDFEVTFIIAKSESEMFGNAIGAHNNTNSIQFDIVLWPNFDWFRSPWVSFFIFDTASSWSTTPPEKDLEAHVSKFISTPYSSTEYTTVLSNLLQYIRHMNYQLSLPSPYNTIAINKEVVFKPRTSAIFPLWEIQVSDFHWSVRGDTPYPEVLKTPIEITATEGK